jgi:hypothetical protein
VKSRISPARAFCRGSSDLAFRKLPAAHRQTLR